MCIFLSAYKKKFEIQKRIHIFMGYQNSYKKHMYTPLLINKHIHLVWRNHKNVFRVSYLSRLVIGQNFPSPAHLSVTCNFFCR